MYKSKLQNLIEAVKNGSTGAIARAITLVENELIDSDEFLEQFTDSKESKIIGVTGPPGAGKSTLVNALIQHWVNQGLKIAVIAIDPSSPFNFGAILGDRIRMSAFYNHPQVFIRSLASRGSLGGLQKKIIEITVLLKQAPFDKIIIETVGIGQSEVEIAGLADCTVLVLVPEAGDEVQMIKAGVMEIADIFVVNKSDRVGAAAFAQKLKLMIHERINSSKIDTPVFSIQAETGVGIEELANGIDQNLSATQTNHVQKLHLLVEKCWQILIEKRMKVYNKKEITQLLEKEILQKDFNLYQFAKKISIK